jgi:hypothetical protein
VFPVKPRKIEQVEGDLVQVTAIKQKEKRVEQGRARSFDELVALGKQRGYKNPWAWARILFHARQQRRGA